jgi:hypothetical protein
MIRGAPEHPLLAGFGRRAKVSAPHRDAEPLSLSKILARVLERGRAAPTEGVHGYEVFRHVTADPKFESGQAMQIVRITQVIQIMQVTRNTQDMALNIAIAAVLMLVLHLAPPSCNSKRFCGTLRA